MLNNIYEQIYNFHQNKPSVVTGEISYNITFWDCSFICFLHLLRMFIFTGLIFYSLQIAQLFTCSKDKHINRFTR